MKRDFSQVWFVFGAAAICLMVSIKVCRGHQMEEAANRSIDNAPALMFDIQAENITPCEFAVRYGELCKTSWHLVQVGGTITRYDKNITCDDLFEIVDGLNEVFSSS